jgi:hypothetical protein
MHLILFNYSLFNDADSKWHYTALNAWSIINLKKRGRKQPWPNAMCNLGIFIKGFRKTTENVTQDR